MGIGDGCATVTGYKLPKPLIESDREGGSEIRSPKSGYRFGCARRDPRKILSGFPAVNFSVKEKDEASPLNRFQRTSSNAFIPVLPESGGFFVFGSSQGWVSGSALVSQLSTRPHKLRTPLKDQSYVRPKTLKT